VDFFDRINGINRINVIERIDRRNIQLIL